MIYPTIKIILSWRSLIYLNCDNHKPKFEIKLEVKGKI